MIFDKENKNGVHIITTKQKALNLLQEVANDIEAERGGGDGSWVDDIRTAIAWIKEN
jgi:hypothetical protein